MKTLDKIFCKYYGYDEITDYQFAGNRKEKVNQKFLKTLLIIPMIPIALLLEWFNRIRRIKQ